MKRTVKRRGLSPVVASVLMILLVVVLAIIIFLWAKGFIDEKVEKFGKPIEETCKNVNFNAARYGSDLEIRNTGNVDIRNLEIKKFDGKGNSESAEFIFKVDALDSVVKTVDFKMKDGTKPDKITIYPRLLGTSESGNSVFTCINSGVTL